MDIIKEVVKINLADAYKFKKFAENFGSQDDLDLANGEIDRWEKYALKKGYRLSEIYCELRV